MKVLFIAPYKGLAKLVDSMQLDLQGYQVTTYIANLEESTNFITSKNYSDSNFDIIISRGGTAKTLRENTSLQVVEVEVSGYDILRLVTYLKNFDDKIGVVGFNNIVSNFKSVSSLIDIDLHFKSINDEKDVEIVLKELQKSNINIVVGDTVTVDKATDLGMEGILLTSGKESIYDSFNKADILLSETMKYRNEIDSIKKMIDYIELPIVLIDDKYKIKYRNKEFTKILSHDSNELVLNQCRKLMGINENLLMDNHISLLLNRSIFEENYILKINKFSDNYMNIMTSVEYNKNSVNKLKTNIKIWDIKFTEIEQFGLSGESLFSEKKVLKFIESRKLSLIGESGSGKELVIQEILQKTNELNFALEFEFFKLDTKHFNNILSYIKMISKECLILIKNINMLSTSKQQVLYEMILKKELYVVFLFNNNTQLENIKGDMKLFKLINENKFTVSSLNSNKNIISSLIINYLEYLNVKYGKQIVGVRNGDFKVYEEYSWPGNLIELKNTIDELYLDAKDEFLVDINALPYKQNQDFLYDKSPYKMINLSKSLSEIEKEVIEEVYKQENFNKSKTAKRLSVDRSTLWRRMNKKT